MPEVNWVTVATGLVSAAILWAVRTLTAAVKGYMQSSHEWREKMDGKVDTIMGATQTTMRAELIHLYEKYMTRGWITPEERAAWYDMHDKYSSMGFNGLIDSYRLKINNIPDREV